MRVSLIQMESNGTKEENEKKAFKLMNDAINDNTDVICLSELFLSWGNDFYQGKVKLSDIEKYQEYARDNNVNIILGSVALESNVPGKTTNTCFVIDRNGDIVGKYDKKYMYEVNREDYDKLNKFRSKEFDSVIIDWSFKDGVFIDQLANQFE